MYYLFISFVVSPVARATRVTRACFPLTNHQASLPTYLPICLATSRYCTSELTLARIIILTGSEATRVPHGASFCRIVGAFEDLVAQEFLLLLSHIFRYLSLNLMRAAGADRVACIACM